jgi:hypothetical protein
MKSVDRLKLQGYCGELELELELEQNKDDPTHH